MQSDTYCPGMGSPGPLGGRLCGAVSQDIFFGVILGCVYIVVANRPGGGEVGGGVFLEDSKSR